MGEFRLRRPRHPGARNDALAPPTDDVCDGTDAGPGSTRWEPNTPLEPGFSLDSAWRGALPPESGYVHLDDVPARTIVELSRDGAHLARTQGSAHGPATGLLDQDVLEVSHTEYGGKL